MSRAAYPPGARHALVRFLSSSGYVGYFPVAPATLACFPPLLVAWFFPEAILPCAVLFTVLGLALCRPAQTAFAHGDPHPFVLDEVAAMFLSVLWVPVDLWFYAAAFVLFRIFDIWKPGPIRALQNSKTPSSIMTDDLLAGLIVNAILQVASRLI